MNVKPSDAVNFAERVRFNQQKLASDLKPYYDFIVCGAGTSGSVVAARLAADLNTKVLLLEAGGTDETDLVTNPNRWPMTLDTELDWGFVAEPNPHLNGRAIRYSMGKVLGGGSSINVSTWSRGHQADWDFYASESGEPSWGYEAVLDLYRRRIEAWTGSPDPDYRGTDGVVHVQPTCGRQRSVPDHLAKTNRAGRRWKLQIRGIPKPAGERKSACCREEISAPSA